MYLEDDLLFRNLLRNREPLVVNNFFVGQRIQLFGEADLAIDMPHQVYALKRSLSPRLSNATSPH